MSTMVSGYLTPYTVPSILPLPVGGRAGVTGGVEGDRGGCHRGRSPRGGTSHAATTGPGRLQPHHRPAHHQVAQRGPGGPLDLPQRGALRVHSGLRGSSQPLAPDALPRRPAVLLPGLREPGGLLADAGCPGQAQHQVLRVPQPGGAGALPPRSPRRWYSGTTTS